MTENLEDAKEELKRIDHLIYVTLKYTRTVDVLLSVVERMINCYEFIVDALVKKALQDGLAEDVPDNPIAKTHFVLDNYDSELLNENLQRYLMFRKLRRVTNDQIDRTNEFRRHVTLTTAVNDQEVKIYIDNITEYFHSLKEFVEFTEKAIK